MIITGKIDVNGRITEFMIPVSDPDAGYAQWGGCPSTLGERVDLLEELVEAARTWAEDNLCRECRDRTLDDGEGSDGMCGDCADRADAEVPGALEPLTLYVTGDDEGPDIFGLIYDDEDEAMLAGRENDVHVWKVPFTPDIDAAVRVESDAEEDGRA